MLRKNKWYFLIAAFAFAINAQAQQNPSGTLVVIPAVGEVTQANDEAHLTFMLEEQGKDKIAAASRVNQKMKTGIDIIKNEDPRAQLKSYGYYTYAVYPDEPQKPDAKPRQPVGWRVGQYLEVKTTNLEHLPKTVAAAQKVLAVSGLQFGLSSAAESKLDQKRIEAAYRNLTERIKFVAGAMGRSVADAVVESIDLEASGAYAPEARYSMASVASAKMASPQVEEPSFEPGETSLRMPLVAKIRFK